MKRNIGELERGGKEEKKERDQPFHGVGSETSRIIWTNKYTVLNQITRSEAKMVPHDLRREEIISLLPSIIEYRLCAQNMATVPAGPDFLFGSLRMSGVANE